MECEILIDADVGLIQLNVKNEILENRKKKNKGERK